MNVIGWVVPVVLVVAGGYLVRSGRRTPRAAPRPAGWLLARGIVVDHERSGLERETTLDRLAFPVVKYLGPDGREHQFSGDYAVDVGDCPPGRRVDILVDPERPDRARLASAEQAAGAVDRLRIALGMAAIVVALGVVAVAGLLATR